MLKAAQNVMVLKLIIVLNVLMAISIIITNVMSSVQKGIMQLVILKHVGNAINHAKPALELSNLIVFSAKQAHLS